MVSDNSLCFERLLEFSYVGDVIPSISTIDVSRIRRFELTLTKQRP
jgi:hypothetical protein